MWKFYSNSNLLSEEVYACHTVIPGIGNIGYMSVNVSISLHNYANSVQKYARLCRLRRHTHIFGGLRISICRYHLLYTWVVVLMACNRYLAISKPLEHHRIITTKYIFIELLILFSLCVSYNFPRFFEYDARATENSTSTSTAYFSPEKEEKLSDLFRNKYYQVYYKIVSFLVLMIFIPLVLLSYFTYKLIREIKISNARRKAMLQGTRFGNARNNLASEEQSITITLLVVVIAFILFHVPIGIHRILQLVFYYKYNSIECVAVNNTTYYVSRVFNAFAEINAAFNFIIYGVTSAQFRRDLQNVCTLRKPSTQSTHRNTRNLTTRTWDRNSNRRNVSENKPPENFSYVPELKEMSVSV